MAQILRSGYRLFCHAKLSAPVSLLNYRLGVCCDMIGNVVHSPAGECPPLLRFSYGMAISELSLTSCNRMPL